MNAQKGGAPITHQARTSLRTTGIILGMGSAGALDEILFHQLLGWHNFYIHAGWTIRLISDGLFHLFTFILLVWAAWRLWQQPRFGSLALEGSILGAGALMGMGGFNLYDGIIQHKILQLHPVREGVVSLFWYDVTWNGVALGLLLCGWLWWHRLS